MGEFRVAFYPTDLQRSRAYYSSGLGFAVIDEWDRPASKGVLLAAGAGLVELLAPAPSADVVVSGGLLLSVEVDDVDRRHAELTGRSVEMTELVVQPWGHRSFSVTDPDGVEVTFFEVLPS